MAYYDKLVDDPNEAFAEIARRRNLTPEQLEARLAALAQGSDIGTHLTLSQAKSHFNERDPPSSGRQAHVDQCPYCQSILEGLRPERVDTSLDKVLRSLASEIAPSAGNRPDEALHAARRGLRKVAGLWPFGLGLASGAAALVALAMLPTIELPGSASTKQLAETRDQLVALQARYDDDVARNLRMQEALLARLPIGSPNHTAFANPVAVSVDLERAAFTNREWVVENAVQRPHGGTLLTLRGLPSRARTSAGVVPRVGTSVFVLEPSLETLDGVREVVADPATGPE